MTSQYLSVGLCKAGDNITLSIGEDIPLRLGILPLLGIANRNLAKLVGVLQDSEICRVGQLVVVSGGAKIQLASGFGELVEIGVNT